MRYEFDCQEITPYNTLPVPTTEMANPLCANVTSSQNHYSDPMPVIGLYIAGATMVCFLLILCDIISGIRHRKLWFPCRYFSLNSLTLTLLSVSSKIPVDLTTSMPSAQDQLSKFTGTAILCIFMCFFYPSVGANSAPENTNNMMALSIVVITVIVNICIQMSTGVIFSFIPEHAISMFFMLVLLCNLWLCSLTRNAEKDTLFDRNKEIFTKCKGSLLRRLEACYLHGCDSNPQFVSCTTLSFKYVSCFISSSVLIFTTEVTLRSFVAHKLRFGSGFSDYGWSMWIILATQILVMLLGASATAVRLLVTVVDVWRDSPPVFISYENEIWLTEIIPFLRDDVLYCLIFFLKISFAIMMILIEVILFLPTAAFYCIFSFACYLAYKYRPSEQIEEYTDLLLENGIWMNPRIKKKCVEEMKGWKSVNGSESPSHLTQLLSRTHPSTLSLEQLNNQFHLDGASFKVSCLYLVFLARIASVLTSSTLDRGNLIESLREVFDIIYFVDSKVNSLEVDSRKKGTFAKFLWRRFFISSASPQVVTGTSQDQPNLAHALEIIKVLEEEISPYYVRQEVYTFVKFINSRDYTSTEELYAYLEQVFIDMLHIFLIQLPEAIFREVTESSVDEYEERVKRMLKFAERVRCLEDKVQWSFPNVATKITSLTTDQTSTVSTSTATTSTTSLDHDNCPSWVIDNFVEGRECCCCGTFCNQSGLYAALVWMLRDLCCKNSCCENSS